MSYTGVNPIAVPLSMQIETDASAYAAITRQLDLADGNVEAARQAFLSGDNPDVLKVRQAIEKLEAKLNAMADQVAAEVPQIDEEEKAKLKVEATALRESVSNGVKAAQQYLKTQPVDKEGIEAWLAEFAEKNPAKAKRGKAVGSAGSTLPRTYVNVSVTGGNWTGEKFESFSPLAAKLNVAVLDIQMAFAKAAGVEHAAISQVKVPVEFTFTPPFENSSTYHISTTPKERAKTGPKAEAVKAA